MALATVRVPEPNVTLPPVPPPPASDAMELLKLFRSRMAAAAFARLTALLGENELAAPARNVPEVMVVVPEYVLPAPPDSIWTGVPVPVRLRVRPPVPVILPAKFVLLLAMALAMVKVPEPNVTLPPVAPPPAREEILLLKLLRFRIAPETFARLTALLADSELAAFACSVPALMVVVPE